MSLIDLITNNVDLNPQIQLSQVGEIKYYVIEGIIIFGLSYLSLFELIRLYHEFIRK